MGSAWPFLLMYGSHNMRHTSFRRLTMVNKTPGSGCHTFSKVSLIKFGPVMDLSCDSPNLAPGVKRGGIIIFFFINL